MKIPAEPRMDVPFTTEITFRHGPSTQTGPLPEPEARVGADMIEELAATRRLQDISTRLIPEGDSEALYHHLLDAATDLMRADMASLQMLPADGRVLRLLASKGFAAASATFWASVHAGSGSAWGQALSTGKRVIITDVETCELVVGTADIEAFRASGIRAVQSTPLVSRSGRPLGMISTHWRAPHQPCERDLRLFDVLARQAADLIERARAEAALAKGAQQKEALYQLADRLHQAKSLDDLYDAALQAIVSGLQCDRASILLFDDTGVMRFVGCVGLSAAYCKAVEGHSPWKPDQEDPTPICIDDIAATAIDDALKATITVEGIRALAFIPLVANGKLIGKFMTYFNAPHVLNNEELELSQAIARQLAFGIARKRAEDALRVSEERLRKIFEYSNDAILLLDPARDRIRDANPKACAMFGYTRDEVLVTPISHFHPEDLTQFLTFMQGVTTDGHGWTDEFACRAKDGRFIASEISASTVTLDGTPCILAIMRDVTERRAAEQALRESEERFQIAACATNDAIWDWNLATNALWWNQGVQTLFGYASAQIGHNAAWWHEHVHDEDRARVVAGIHAVIDSGESFWRDEYRFRRADGTDAVVFDRGYVIRDNMGNATRMIGAMQDLTERKRAEEALKEADRRKDVFLATLAHELRNPLAPLCNGLQVMKQKGNDDLTLEQCRSMMERQLGHMVRLVDDLLDVSRISRGKIELRKEPVELTKVIQQAIEAIRPTIEASGHELHVDTPADRLWVDADQARLAQVVGNLLNNACKFTGAGGRIRLVLESSGNQAVIRVQDNGVGIDAEQSARIFEMFTQVDTSLERSQSGLGIGLTLVKSLTEMHGGTVRVHSAGLGHGSEFVVHLPTLATVPDAPLAAPVTPAPATIAARRILVVDDNNDAANSLAALLKLGGHETRTAYDGLEAVEAAATFRPELVLLDIGLPKLNGYEVARRMRSQLEGQDTVLVALTGWGQAHDRQKSKDAGFDEHLIKPVDHYTLMTLLSRLPPRGCRT
jgi:PAS domain S-box-containing protein